MPSSCFFLGYFVPWSSQQYPLCHPPPHFYVFYLFGKGFLPPKNPIYNYLKWVNSGEVHRKPDENIILSSS